MCNDDDCQCQTPHEQHTIVKLKGIVQKINKAAIVPEEVKKAKTVISRLFDVIARKVSDEWEKMRNFFDR